MTTDELFFYEHAGYSFDPKTETPEQGRERCARALAAAEQRFFDHGDATCEWERDYDGEWSARKQCIRFEVCEWCCIRVDGLVVASLGSILDPSEDYRRVVRAELALDAFPS